MKELEAIRGRHTELVSVYIPAGYNLVDIINQLYTEKSTATNIKSKQTRKNVLDALEKIIQHLRIFKETPPNGLIVFCGNVSPVEGKEDLKIWSFEPPEKMNTKIYWCDQVFVLDPLREMIAEKEVYGLIVLDAKEADIGLLYGKKITTLKHLDSTVPGKAIKGGMCIHEDSLVQLDNGELIPIKNLKTDKKLLVYSFSEFKPLFVDSFKIMKRETNVAYEIVTKEPAFKLTVTPEHKIFVVTDKGIEEKYVEDLKIGEKILAIKKIETLGKLDNLTEEFCQFLGYALGDGTLDNNRIILYDKDIQIAKFYSKLIKKALGIPSRILKRRNTHEIRIYSIDVVRKLTKEFPELLVKTRLRNIPIHISQLSENNIAKFIKGLFDAEGYISQNKIAIRLTNEKIIQTLQLLLLRLGIVSSVSKADKFDRYNLQITNPIYVKQFYRKIGFSSLKKLKRLKSIIRKVSSSRVDRIPISGKMVRKQIETINLNKQYFENISMLLTNARNVSYNVFNKNIIHKLQGRLHELSLKSNNIKKLRVLLRLKQKDVSKAVGCSIDTLLNLEKGRTKNSKFKNKILTYLKENQIKLIQKTREILNYFVNLSNSNLIQTIISKKLKVKAKGLFYDLYVPKYNSFIVNGLVVHNSQVRYDRIREDAINEFLTKVGEIASESFLKQPELKGVIIGGPGYIKDQLVKGEYLNHQLRQKILGIKDIGYTGEQGFEELVRRSEDLLKEATVMKERQLLQKFLTELQKGGNVVYGYTQTIEALNLGAVETLLISEEFDWVRVKLKCDNTHEAEKDLPEEEIERQVCEVCGEVMKVEDKDYLGELLAEKAQNFGTKVELISTDTPEGKQFKELGGIGGFLRYKIR